MISPKMWDDERFVALPTADAKLLWCYLLTGPSSGVPGLRVGGPALYADALRADVELVQQSLDTLLRMSLIDYDKRRRLMRIPTAPRQAPCSNQFVVKGWWRAWQELPDCAIKVDHLDSLYAAKYSPDGKHREWFDSVWSVTFGTVDVVNTPDRTSSQQTLFADDNIVVLQTVGRRSTRPTRTSTSTSTSTSSHVDQPRRSPPRKRANGSATPDGLRIAEYLLEAIRSHSPEFTLGSGARGGWTPERILDGWGGWIDRSLRRGRTEEQIKRVIDYAHRNGSDTFWRALVLSGRKLHEKFDQLAIRANHQSAARGGGGIRVGSVDPPPRSEYGAPGPQEI